MLTQLRNLLPTQRSARDARLIPVTDLTMTCQQPVLEWLAVTAHAAIHTHSDELRATMRTGPLSTDAAIAYLDRKHQLLEEYNRAAGELRRWFPDSVYLSENTCR